MLRVKDSLIEQIINIGVGLEYNVKIHPPSYIIQRLSFRYNPIRMNKDKIKVEINFLNRIPILTRVKRYFFNIFSDVLDDFSIYTYSIEELIAMKTKAFLERKLPRDLFDIYSLLNANDKIDFGILKKVIIFYFCMSSKIQELISNIQDFQGFFKQFIKLIEEISEKDFNIGVGNFLSFRKPIIWEEIKTELINLYSTHLKLNDAENQFWKSFFLKNEYSPNLICNGLDKFNKNLDKHPAILHVIAKRIV